MTDYARARSPHILSSLPYSHSQHIHHTKSHILETRNGTLHTKQKKSSLFYDFVPLWGNISPYTYRGARWRRAPFSFFFHGESHSHIYANTSDNIPQRQSAQSASFELESCTFTNIQSRCAIKFQRIIFVVRRESGNFAH